MLRNIFKLQLLLMIVLTTINMTSFADKHNQPNNKTSTTVSSNKVISVNNIDEERKLTDYRYYSVEVILFRHKDKSGISEEFWVPFYEDEEELETKEPIVDEENKIEAISLMPQFGLPGTVDAPVSHFELGEYFSDDKRFESFDNLVSQLSPEQMQLKNEAAHIRYAKQYQLITHFGWTQPGYDAETTLPVKLNLPTKHGDIKGTIKVSLARYLHTEVDLTLVEEVCRQVKKEPDSMDVKVQVLLQENKQENKTDKNEAYDPKLASQEKNQLKEQYETRCQMEIIPFKQSRKMRSKKLHYIDHPAFGLLVYINRYKLNKDNETEEDEEPAPEKTN